LKVQEDRGGDLGRGDWPAEEVSLSLIALCFLDEIRLFGGLDALDGDAHVQFTSEGDDRLYDRLGISPGAVEPGQEASVDFDLVERKAP